MTLPKIYLIRHGEKTQDGKELTKRGILQAKLLGKYLKSEGITKIISSTINRSIQTAEIINKTLKLKHMKDERINEIHPLRNEGKLYQEERKRVKEFYEDVILKNKKKILVVAHGNVNRYIIALTHKIALKNVRIVQIPTCMNILERKKSGSIRIRAINDTSHLPKKLKVDQPY